MINAPYSSVIACPAQKQTQLPISLVTPDRDASPRTPGAQPHSAALKMPEQTDVLAN